MFRSEVQLNQARELLSILIKKKASQHLHPVPKKLRNKYSVSPSGLSLERKTLDETLAAHLRSK